MFAGSTPTIYHLTSPYSLWHAYWLRCLLNFIMNLRLDPWAAEYNTAYYAEVANRTEDQVSLDTALEQDSDAWQPIQGIPPETAWTDMFFLDGSRRVEARVLLEQDRRQMAFGAMGTYAIGAVSCCAHFNRPATFIGDMQVKRICALSSGYDRVNDPRPLELTALAPFQLGHLRYDIVPTEETDADAVVRKLQQEMLAAEKELGVRLAREHPNALIVVDGRRSLVNYDRNLVGYVKTIHDIKINRAQLDVVQKLEQGERSPIYLVNPGRSEQQYFEWFLRLRDPRPWLYSLAGMVRLQAYAGNEPAQYLEDTINLANWLSATLPKLASRQHQDPRAPQQLLPIRALEAELRRRMGHPAVLRRRITRFLSQE